MFNKFHHTLGRALGTYGIIGDLASLALTRLARDKKLDSLNAKEHYLTDPKVLSRASKTFDGVESKWEFERREPNKDSDLSAIKLPEHKSFSPSEPKVAVVVKVDDETFIRYYSLSTIIEDKPLLSQISDNTQIIFIVSENEGIPEISNFQKEASKLEIHAEFGIIKKDKIITFDIKDSRDEIQDCSNEINSMKDFLNEALESMNQWGVTQKTMLQTKSQFNLELLTIVKYYYWQYLQKVIADFSDEDKSDLDLKIKPEIKTLSGKKGSPEKLVADFSEYLTNLYSQYLANRLLGSKTKNEVEIKSNSEKLKNDDSKLKCLAAFPNGKIIISLKDFENINQAENQNKGIAGVLTDENGVYSHNPTYNNLTLKDEDLPIINDNLSEDDILKLATRKANGTNGKYAVQFIKSNSNLYFPEANLYRISENSLDIIRAINTQDFSIKNLVKIGFFIPVDNIELDLSIKNKTFSELSTEILELDKELPEERRIATKNTTYLFREYLEHPEFIKPFIKYAKIKGEVPDSKILGQYFKILIEDPDRIKTILNRLKDEDKDLNIFSVLLFKGTNRLELQEPEIPVVNDTEELLEAIASVQDTLENFTDFGDNRRKLRNYLIKFQSIVTKEFNISLEDLSKNPHLQEACTDQITNLFVLKVKELIKDISRSQKSLLVDLKSILVDTIQAFKIFDIDNY